MSIPIRIQPRPRLPWHQRLFPLAAVRGIGTGMTTAPPVLAPAARTAHPRWARLGLLALLAGTALLLPCRPGCFGLGLLPLVAP